jgi:hypothetical protein
MSEETQAPEGNAEVTTTEVAPEVAEMQAKLEKLSSLERYVDALGGADSLIELASYGHQVRNNPTVQDFIRSGGRAPEKEPEPEEEYYDPEVKALNAKYSTELEQLKAQNASLQSRLDQTEVSGLKSHLTNNMEAALGRFKDDPEHLEMAKREIEQSVAQLERAAKAGDPAAIAQLRSLGSEGGVTVLKMMTTDTFERSVEKRLAAAKKNDNSAVLDKATDGKVTTRPPLPATTVSIKPGTKITSQMTRKFGKDPNTFWR